MRKGLLRRSPGDGSTWVRRAKVSEVLLDRPDSNDDAHLGRLRRCSPPIRLGPRRASAAPRQSLFNDGDVLSLCHVPDLPPCSRSGSRNLSPAPQCRTPLTASRPRRPGEGQPYGDHTRTRCRTDNAGPRATAVFTSCEPRTRRTRGLRGLPQPGRPL